MKKRRYKNGSPPNFRLKGEKTTSMDSKDATMKKRTQDYLHLTVSIIATCAVIGLLTAIAFFTVNSYTESIKESLIKEFKKYEYYCENGFIHARKLYD